MAGCMREAVKALNITFSAVTVPYPLPDELRTSIERYLERYDDIDYHDSQHFHEDLHKLYMRHVAGNHHKHGPFLSALRLLRSAITTESHLMTWWDLVLQPTLDGIGYKKQEIEDAQEFLQSILVYDPENDYDGEHEHLSALFTNKVLDAYLARTNVPSSAEETMSPENNFIADQLETILVTFGRKLPKALLIALDKLFVQKQYRLQALNLLSAFVRLQPPHLHLVLETPLIHDLEKSLLIDTSSTVIELALVVLIMFLPHICGTITSDHHLQKLFLIYARVLCWDKLVSVDRSRHPEDVASMIGEALSTNDDEEYQAEPAWEQLKQSVDYPDSSPPTLMHFYTFLYGLFPLNFMSFIRKPRKYLESLNFPGAQDFDLDQDLIYTRTEPYRKVHLLHPNMFTTTAEDELSESKWSRSDPADIVAECMDLCVAVSSSLNDPGPPPTSALPALPNVSTQLSLNKHGDMIGPSEQRCRDTQATMCHPFNEPLDPFMPNKPSTPLLIDRVYMDSPTIPASAEYEKQDLPAILVTCPRKTTPQPNEVDIFIQSTDTSKTHAQIAAQNQNVALMQREIMLLQNDLKFERYLKLQHLAHVGQLQRKHIKEATADAETQNLINTNKTLRTKLAKANELYAQVKKETLTSRSQSKKWENDLNTKLRAYRDSEKSLQSTESSLRHELQQIQSDYHKFKEMIEKAEAERIKAQQRTLVLEYEVEQFGSVRRELETAKEKVSTLETLDEEVQSLMRDRDELRFELEAAHMRLKSREQEQERSNATYEHRLGELESRLQAAEKSSNDTGQLSAAIQQQIDSALTASNVKLKMLKKTHYCLLEQYTDLQLKYYNLEGEQEAKLSRSYSQSHSHTHTHRIEAVEAPTSRRTSLRQKIRTSSKYLPSISTQQVPHGEVKYDRPECNSPQSGNDFLTITAADRPARTDSQVNPGTSRIPMPASKSSNDFENHDQSSSGSPPRKHFRSGKSSMSIGSDDSAEITIKGKAAGRLGGRVFGRGNAQNSAKKGETDHKKSEATKTGGFRGLKNIM